MELKTQVYQKENTLSIRRLLKDSIVDIYRSRFLARQLAVRDIKAQYRQSYLGLLWAFANPLATAMVWIFLNNSGTIRVTDTGVPYPLFAFTGTLIWSIISESINSPIQSTTSARSIISKINFPKEALIVSGIYKLMVNTGIKTLLLIFFLIFFDIGFHPSQLLFPVAILGAVLFGSTIGLLITPLGMLYKDVGKAISFGLQFLMYATPVVYAIPKDGFIKELMEANPITPIIMVARDTLVAGEFAYLTYFLIVIALCVPLFFLALIFYRMSIPVIVERINA
jgi:lipopolysaccharide transport system permease protein